MEAQGKVDQILKVALNLASTIQALSVFMPNEVELHTAEALHDIIGGITASAIVCTHIKHINFHSHSG